MNHLLHKNESPSMLLTKNNSESKKENCAELYFVLMTEDITKINKSEIFVAKDSKFAVSKFKLQLENYGLNIVNHISLSKLLMKSEHSHQ